MAHALNLNHALPRSATPGVFADLVREFAVLRRYLAVSAELRGFSDRDLADIGVSRLNIREIAREAARAS